jgi:hypothetical protein
MASLEDNERSADVEAVMLLCRQISQMWFEPQKLRHFNLAVQQNRIPATR